MYIDNQDIANYLGMMELPKILCLQRTNNEVK